MKINPGVPQNLNFSYWMKAHMKSVIFLLGSCRGFVIVISGVPILEMLTKTQKV